MRYLPPITVLLATLGALMLGAGCADEPIKPTTNSSSDALRDPFNYKPFSEDPNISGGGTADLDKKALKKDWDHVWLR
jgi:hypothetical protein